MNEEQFENFLRDHEISDKIEICEIAKKIYNKEDFIVPCFDEDKTNEYDAMTRLCIKLNNISTLRKFLSNPLYDPIEAIDDVSRIDNIEMFDVFVDCLGKDKVFTQAINIALQIGNYKLVEHILSYNYHFDIDPHSIQGLAYYKNLYHRVWLQQKTS